MIYEHAFFIPRVIAFYFGKNCAQRGGEPDERIVLLWCEIILTTLFALHLADLKLAANWIAHKVRREHAAIAHSRGDRDPRATLVILGIPLSKGEVRFVRRIRSHICDFDAD